MRRVVVIPMVVLMSCGLEPGVEASAPTARLQQAGYQRQGYQRQGYQRQGFEQLGLESGPGALKGFSLSSLLRTPTPLYDRAELYQGELVITESAIDGDTPSFAGCSGAAWGLGRSCGWRSAGVGQCTPGATVEVRDLGTGDSMLRVCPGTTPCEPATALTANDDWGGTVQARVSFTCPASARFNLELAPYVSGMSLSPALTASGPTSFPVLTVRRGVDLAGRALGVKDFSGGERRARILSVAPELGPDHLALHGVTPGNVGPASIFRYQVEVSDNGNWVPLCDLDFQDESGQQRPVALATPGWWDSTATRSNDADLFTFSCRRGVITKCVRWGYRGFVTDTESRDGVTLEARLDQLQACTRMARADYCGNGESWTREETLINIYDLGGVQVRGEPPMAISFEAAWTASGAACLSHPRWDNAPAKINYVDCPQLFDQTTHVRKECGSAEEAAASYSVRLFNDSELNAWPDAGS